MLSFADHAIFERASLVFQIAVTFLLAAGKTAHFTLSSSSSKNYNHNNNNRSSSSADGGKADFVNADFRRSALFRFADDDNENDDDDDDERRFAGN